MAVMLSLLVAVAGCGKGEPKTSSTQVAAKVNADEITIHQVNSVLSRAPNVNPERADRAKREILDRLIDQQLARQQAVALKLDQTPAVVQALEAARSEILARAYLERIAAAQPKPTPAETRKYYTEHPELFAQRRVFSLEEVAFAANEDLAAALRGRIGKIKSMQEIVDWLQAQEIKVVPSQGVRAAEQLPLELLPKLQTMNDGEIQLFSASEGRYQVIRVVASRAAPVDEATAAPRIAQYLGNRRSSEAISADMKKLKAQAKIEYVGEFAAGAASAEAKSRTQAENAAKAAAQAKAKEDKEAQERAEALSKTRSSEADKARLEAERKASAAPPSPVSLPRQAVEKGIGGLK